MNCDQEGCNEKAVCSFTWPGHEELAACPRHGEFARNLARHFNFTLLLLPLEELIAKRAKETVHRLTGGGDINISWGTDAERIFKL